jgi:hypothetical protein
MYFSPMMKTFKLLFAAPLLFLAACSDSPAPGNDSIPPNDSTPPTDTVTPPPPVIYRDTFHVGEFIRLADSMFTTTSKEEVDVTVNERNVDRSHMIDGAIFPPVAGGVSKHYFFKGGKTNTALNFTIRQCIYNDTATLNRAFVYLHSQKTLDDDHGGTPGLSYGNDCVIRSGRQLLWLHTGCTFSYEDHQELRGLMLRCVPGIVVEDEIDCKCGDAACK